MTDLVLSLIIWASVAGNIFLGIRVYNLNPKSPTHRTLALLALVSALWAVGLFFFAHPIIFSSLIWLKIVYLIVLVMIGVFFFFSFFFPLSKQGKWKLPVILFVITALPFTYLIIFTRQFLADVVSEPWGPRQILGPAYIFFGVWSSFFPSWTLYNFFSSFRRTSGVEKLQLRYLFLGLFFYVAVPVTLDVILPIFFGDSRFIWFSPISSIFLVGAVTYAITKHRFLDIRILISRGVIFTLLFGVITLLFTYGIVFLGNYLPAPISGFIAALTVVLMFIPLKKLLENLTEKLFFKGEYVADILLSNLTHIMAGTLDLERMTEEILKTLTHEMRLSKAAFLIIDKHKIVRVLGFGHSDHEYAVSELEALLHAGSLSGRASFIYEELINPKIKELFNKLDISTAIPIRVENNEVAILILGPKRSGDIYFKKDLDVLEIFASEAGIAIQNAKAFAEIKKFSQELEKRVEERTHELKESQEKELEKAREVARLKDEFVFIASHELKTPVTAIRGFMELVEEDIKNFPKDVRENLAAVVSASSHLNQLINDLLEISRSEAGTMKIELQPTELLPIIQGVVKELSPLARERNIQVKFEAPQPLPKVLASPDKIREIITNLLGNAIKYNRKGGKVDIMAFRLDDRIIMEFRDTGYGIPKDKQNKIFQKFFRAPTKEAQEVMGTGLGLFITRMLVEKMGGEVMFSSTEGKGSTFAFSLKIQ
jgi:signal transduction histidine kinase